MPSGADLEYQKLLNRSGQTNGAGLDGARLAQMEDSIDPGNPSINVNYNSDGTVSSVVENGITTTFTYNSDGTVSTQTRLGVTRTFTYTNGNLTGVQ